MSEAILKPSDGLIVRDPDTLEPLPVEGAAKPLRSYWLRRIDCGDVTIELAGSAGAKTKTSSEK